MGEKTPPPLTTLLTEDGVFNGRAYFSNGVRRPRDIPDHEFTALNVPDVNATKQEKALRLLFEHLTDEQRKDYEENKYIIVHPPRKFARREATQGRPLAYKIWHTGQVEVVQKAGNGWVIYTQFCFYIEDQFQYHGALMYGMSANVDTEDHARTYRCVPAEEVLGKKIVLESGAKRGF